MAGITITSLDIRQTSFNELRLCRAYVLKMQKDVQSCCIFISSAKNY